MARKINWRLDPDFVLSVACNENAAVRNRIEAYQWLGYHESNYSRFREAQIDFVRSEVDAITDHVCLCLCGGIESQRLDRIYIPVDLGYRDRFISAMRDSHVRRIRWLLPAILVELGDTTAINAASLAFNEAQFAYRTPNCTFGDSIIAVMLARATRVSQRRYQTS